ncbi:hypothetical protein HOE04_05315 [archaeon]|jgi:hypothetical protein|nr:hypothetical protein [archaeon]
MKNKEQTKHKKKIKKLQREVDASHKKKYTKQKACTRCKKDMSDKDKDWIKYLSHGYCKKCYLKYFKPLEDIF